MAGKYKLVLFDLDGVIVDSKRNMELSWSAVQAVFEIKISFENYFALIGRPFNDIMSKLGLDDSDGKIKRVYDVASSCRIDLVDIYKDCFAVISEIKKKGIRIGVVTSKDKDRTLEIIKRMDILFDVVECPDSEGRGKPSPDPLFRAMLKCRRDPSETIYIGDMDVDMNCAQRAGVDYIFAGWGYGNCEEDVTRASKPKDILKIIF